MASFPKASLRAPLFAWTVLFVSISNGAHGQSQAQIEQSERGKQLMAEQKFEAAASVYRSLAQAVPDNPGLLLNLGMALHLAGHSRQAIAPLTNAIKLDSSILPAWLFLGASYFAAAQSPDFLRRMPLPLAHESAGELVEMNPHTIPRFAFKHAEAVADMF